MGLLVVPTDVLDSRIAALLPPADRQDGSGRNSAFFPTCRSAPPPASAGRRLTLPPHYATAALPSTHRRLRLSHTCRALRATSFTAGWFPEVRVALRRDNDAEALGAWLRRSGGECWKKCIVRCSEPAYSNHLVLLQGKRTSTFNTTAGPWTTSQQIPSAPPWMRCGAPSSSPSACFRSQASSPPAPCPTTPRSRGWSLQAAGCPP